MNRKHLRYKPAFKRLARLVVRYRTLFGIAVVLLVISSVLILLRHRAPPGLTLNRIYGSAYAYEGEMPAAQMKASLGTRDGAIAIRIERQNSSLEFVSPLASASIKRDTNDSAVYSSSDHQTIYKYGLTATGLKEDIVLKQKPQTNKFTSVIKVTNLIVNRTSDGLPVFTDAAGSYQFHFARPYAEDASGNRTYGVKYVLAPAESPVLGLSTIKTGRQRLSGLGFVDKGLTASTYTLYMEVDEQWLGDPKRIYPVTIDPTITHNTSSTFATGQTNRIFDTGSGSNPNLATYYQELPSDPYTVALWHLNETSNGTCTGGKDACDSSGNANHGTQTATSISTTNQRLGSAARSFDGTNSFITVAASTTLNYSQSNPFTVEAWANPSALGATRYIFNKQENVGNEFLIQMYLNSSNQFTFVVGKQSVAANTATGTTTATTGTWFHVAGVSDGNSISLYVNGKLEATTAITISASTQSVATAYIGELYDTTSRWNGLIDEVRISSTARTGDEIKADAQRFPYSVYTSPVMDFSKATAFNSLSWNERGVMTGDGETASSSTGLVAQWNFNATSGTLATNDAGAGTCGGTASNCDGTLTNFASTASQDQAPGTGWTAINRRWGAGALMFDGSNDYVTTGATSAFNFGTNAFTISWWMKEQNPTQSTIAVFGDRYFTLGQNGNYSIRLDTNAILLITYDGQANLETVTVPVARDSVWHNMVIERSSNTVSIYRDGVLLGTGTVTKALGSNTSALKIGWDGNNGTFNGAIDAVQVYSRALPPHEILSNYNAANMEFLTRVGDTTTPDDGTWEAWRPVTSEVQIDSMDSTTRLNDRVYNTTYDWTVQNPNVDQNWIKFDNTIPTASNTVGSNGRVPLGTSGGDNVGTGFASVILDGGIYKMWYSGSDGSFWRIYYATSTDGRTWIKFDNTVPTASDTTGNNGRIPLGATAGRGDTGGTFGPTVIKDGSTYKMWYSGYNTSLTPNQWRIYYATSSDGLTWTKLDNTVPAASNTTGTNGRIPVGTSGGDFSSTAGGGTLSPTVIRDGNVYRLWYSGYDGSSWRIYNAVSGDGLTWTKTDNSVPATSNTCSTNGRIPLGISGGDTSSTLYQTVIKDGSTYRMWYTGTATNYQLYTATSNDSLVWCKINNTSPAATNSFSSDGRIAIGSGTVIDSSQAEAGTTIKNGNDYFMWYTGSDASNFRIGMVKLSLPPVITNTDSVTKIEGTSSRTLGIGNTSVTDSKNIGYWHLDETSGTTGDDYYFQDSGLFAQNAGPVGNPIPSVVDGIYGNALQFNGSNYLAVKDSTYLSGQGVLTMQAWFKTTTIGATIIGKYFSTNPFQGYGLGVGLGSGTAHKLNCWVGGTLWTNSATTVDDGQWHYGACTYDGTNVRVYVDGKLDGGPTAQTANLNSTGLDLFIGAFNNGNSGAGNFLTGTIDEVRLDARALTDEEIQEQYRSGNNYRISKTIASTNISSATKVPFYIASDRQGRIGELTVGNSAFANYETDANTLGLWHLEEKTGSGAYIKDSSGDNNNGSPTGTSFVQGMVGKARSFTGTTNEQIGVGSSPSLGGSSTFTVSAWVYPTSVTGEHRIFDRGSGASPNTILFYQSGTSLNLLVNNGAAAVSLTGVFAVNNWYYVTAVYTSGGEEALYVNGVKVVTGTAGAVTPTAGALATVIGCTSGEAACSSSFVYSGIIDEVRLDNVARTSDQIRQAFEIGKRTHPIIVDFKARLNSGNLIANSGDTSFTIDATQFGAQNKGDNLYIGDKIIVREKISATTYIAQGTVTSVTSSTGATTVTSWDAGSTFPPNGYSVNATVFKWQREWWDPTGATLSTHRNAVSQLTFRPTEYTLGANIWLDDLRYGGPYLTTPTGSTVTSSTGHRYFQYQSIQSSTDTQVSASLVSVTLDYTANSVPAIPSLDAPTNAATGQSVTPQLKTTSTDADGDYLRYKIQLCTDVAMTLNCQTFDQTLSQTGWSGQNTQPGNTAYTSGTQATYTVQTPLLANTTYYWRSYAIDPGGTNIFSSTQASPFSFTTSAAPTAPSNLLLNGATSPVTNVAPGSTPTMSAQFNDPTVGDTTTQAEIQVSTDSTFGSITHWNSGVLTIASTVAGAQSPNITYAGATLQTNTTFYWRIRFTDTSGNVGAWSSAAQFSTGSVLPPPCTLNKAGDNSSITVQWTDNNTLESGYTIEKNTDGAGFVSLTTTAANATSYIDSAISNGHTYTYRVRSFVGSTNSDWCTTATLSVQLGNFRFN